MRPQRSIIITFAVLMIVLPVIAPAQTPTGVSLNPNTVKGGFNTFGTVSFSADPPSVVQLSSGNQAVATVQPLGVDGAVFEFTVTTFPVAQSTTVTISASSGGVTKTTQLTVLPPELSYLVLRSTIVVGGQQVTADIGLDGSAPPGGFVVSLSSSNTQLATVPASVTVGANTRYGSFSVTTFPVVVPTPVNITASAGGVNKTKQLYVTVLGLASITVRGTSITGGRDMTENEVSLTGPTPSDVAIQLASSNTAVATVPASVTIPAQATKANFTITTVSVAVPTTVTISASAGGVTRTSAPINVLPGLSSLTLTPLSVVGGQNATGQVGFSAPPSGGVDVQLSSSHPGAATVPESVKMGTAATKIFEVTTRPVAQSITATISASVGAITKTAQLNIAAAALTSVGAATPIVGGRNSTGSATLDGPAPSGGFVVQLSCTNPAVVAIPSTATVPAGATVVEFPIQTFPVAQSTAVTITAFGGSVIKNVQMNVVHLEVASVSVVPTIVGGHTSPQGEVRLNATADSGGFPVSLSSSNSAVATVPASITVVANGTQTSFPVTTVPVTQSTAVAITATGGGVDKTAQLNVVPPTLLGITLSTVTGGDSPLTQIRLNGPAPAGGVVVDLSNSNTAVAVLAAPSITVPAGSTTASVKVGTVPVAQSTAVTFTAAAGGVSRTGTLMVLPPVPSSVTLNPGTIAGATDVTGQVTLNGPAPSSGYTINLSSSNPNVAAIKPSITVEAGATTAGFKFTTAKVGQPITVNITASAGGGSKSAVLTVTP